MLLIAIILSTALTSCSQYKSSWSCKNPEGIGCSSITYADQIARKHIILNEEQKSASKINSDSKTHKHHHSQKESNKILIKEHYSDFEKYSTKEVDLE